MEVVKLSRARSGCVIGGDMVGLGELATDQLEMVKKLLFLI